MTETFFDLDVKHQTTKIQTRVENHLVNLRKSTFNTFNFYVSIYHKHLDLQSKKDSNDQELIQSSTTPVPGYKMRK